MNIVFTNASAVAKKKTPTAAARSLALESTAPRKTGAVKEEDEKAAPLERAAGGQEPPSQERRASCVP